MGWQDRDYASERPYQTPGRVYRPGLLEGHSIVTVLIVVNVVVYALGALFPPIEGLLKGRQQADPFGRLVITYGIAEMWADGVMRGQIWRLVTAQYLHADIWHLFVNMLVLHFLGRPLERMWSPKKLFVVYTLCGIAGNVFYTLLGWRGVIPGWMQAVGASGSIYGLLGIVAVLFPNALIYIYFLFPIRLRTAAIIFGVLSFFTIVERGGNFGGEACHLAGLVFGVWWAMKGDAWWSGRRSGVRTVRFKVKPSRGGGGAFEDRMEQRRADAKTIDDILRKVHDGGIHTLTEAEKTALREATERQRLREGEAGRVDRL